VLLALECKFVCDFVCVDYLLYMITVFWLFPVLIFHLTIYFLQQTLLLCLSLFYLNFEWFLQYFSFPFAIFYNSAVALNYFTLCIYFFLS
jgi:hypothetical protein